MPGKKGMKHTKKRAPKITKKAIFTSKIAQNKRKSPLKIENKAENAAENPPERINLDAKEPTAQNTAGDDFDQIAAKLAAQSDAAVDSESKPTTVQNENSNAPPNLSVVENKPEPEESWAPVCAIGYTLIGELVEHFSGIPELNYTEDEIETLAVESEKIIMAIWPDAAGGMTEQQKAIFFSGAVIVNVHVSKYKAYIKIKEIQLEIEKQKTEQMRLKQQAETNSEKSKSAA